MFKRLRNKCLTEVDGKQKRKYSIAFSAKNGKERDWKAFQGFVLLS